MLRPSRVLLIALMLVLLPAAPALAAPASGETGRYYVVGPPVHGQPDYLYAIAVATLHNGNRYQEIFRLNQGRVQPDGAELTDPAEVLHPGWVLALPKDARGSRVLTGPLPLDQPSSSPPPAAAPPPAPVTTKPAAGGDPLLTYGGLTIAVLLVGFAVMVLRRRPADTSPLAVPVATSSVRRAPSAPPRMPAAAAPVAPAPARGVPPKSDRAATAFTGPSVPTGVTATGGSGIAAARPSAATRPSAPDRSSAAEAGSAGSAVSGRGQLLAVPAAGSGRVLDLRAELRCGGDPGLVRLLGGRGANPYIWLGPGMQPPGGRPGVVLGRGAGGRLWVDLAAAPDVLTVTGDPAAGLRQARALIDQLYADGMPFTVVGNALEASPLEADPATPQVLIAAGVPAHEMPGLLARVRASAGRLLPILVGDVPAARWSLSFPENA